jgi:tetratricopeptide (TPR) repeat protein
MFLGRFMAKHLYVLGRSRRVCLCAALFYGLAQQVVLGQQTGATPQADPLVAIHALVNAGQLEESEKALRSYLADHPSSADAHFLLGYTLFREQRAKDSLAEFTEGAKFRRPGAADLKIVAADYVLLGDFTDADTWLSAVAKETPKDADAWYLLGRAKYNENRFAEAIVAFEHVLSLQPNDVRAKDNQGLSYQGLNQIENAKAAFETAIAWQANAPLKSAQPYLNLGVLLLDQDQAQQALPHLEKAVALAPRNPRVREELGRAYDELKLMDKAQHELQQAVALAPNASGLHFKLGQIYRRQGMSQQAQQEFDICAKLNSTHSSVETPNPASPN